MIKLMLLLVFSTLVLITPAFAEEGESVTFQLDKDMYFKNDTIIVTGHDANPSGTTTNIVYNITNNPSNSSYPNQQIVPLDSDGNFTLIISLSDHINVNIDNGYYLDLSVNWLSSSSIRSTHVFNYTHDVKQDQPSSMPDNLSFDLSFDRSYLTDQYIVFDGHVKNYDASYSDQIIIDILSDDGTLIHTSSYSNEDNGDFNFGCGISEDIFTEYGDYIVKVKYGSYTESYNVEFLKPLVGISNIKSTNQEIILNEPLSQYYKNSNIEISGNIKDIILDPDYKVALIFTSKAFDTHTIFTNLTDNGYFTTSFLAGDTAGIMNESGIYEIEVIYGDYLETIDINYINQLEQTPEPVVLDVSALMQLHGEKSSGGGCGGDCTSPTLGLNKHHKRVVDNGFIYNGNQIQVERWHTPYPLINATVGEMNKVSIKVYENRGINNMKLVQFGLGAEEIGATLNSLEVLIEVHLETFGQITEVAVDNIVIKDKDNLIDNDTVTADTYVVKCTDSDVILRCVQVDLSYSYRESTFNNIMVVSVSDKKRNSQTFYFNDGIEVLGESLNPPPTYIMPNKHSGQQTEDLTLTLTRVDKFTDIWVDKYGIEYQKLGDYQYTRITPYESKTCDNTPWTTVSNPDRRSCQFKAILEWETNRVTVLAEELYGK